MAKFLHLYQTTSAFEADYNGEYYHEPWTSFTRQDGDVNYNKRGNITSIPYYDHGATTPTCMLPVTEGHILDYTEPELATYFGHNPAHFKIRKEFVSSYELTPPPGEESAYNVYDLEGYYKFLSASSGYENCVFHIVLNPYANLQNARIDEVTYSEPPFTGGE